MNDDESLLEIIYGSALKIILCCLMMVAIGCGKKWEKMMGQETAPEVKYIQLTADYVNVGINTNPVQWMDSRFSKAKYINVWACTDDNLCVEIAEDRPNGDALA